VLKEIFDLLKRRVDLSKPNEINQPKLVRSKLLGFDVYKHVEKYPSTIDHFILSKMGMLIEATLIFLIIFVLTSLLVDKLWITDFLICATNLKEILRYK